MDICEYTAADGRSPFSEWLSSLSPEARRRVNMARERMTEEKFSNVKRLSGGISEYRINFGPGYRIYFGREGNSIIILLGGGTKQRQSGDISVAKDRWDDYLQRR